MLDLIKRTPHFSLTSKSISSLQDFLNGYMLFGCTENIYHPGEPNFDEFKYWILEKGKGTTGIGNPYSTVLLELCNGDEEKAFDIFFEYLEQFKKDKTLDNATN